jgi:hypothetical protein
MKVTSILVLISVLLFNESSQAQVPNFTWAERIGSNEPDSFNGACSDSSGNLYVFGRVGSFFDTLVDTVFVGNTRYMTDNSHNFFIVSYTPSGVLRWTKFFGSQDNISRFRRSLAYDNHGSIYCVFEGADTTNLVDTILNSSFHEAIIAKFDTSGNFIIAKQIKTEHSEVNSIKTDLEGNVYICGWFSGLSEFDDGKYFTPKYQDAFIAKYSGDLKLQWLNAVPSSSKTIWTDFSLDKDGSINLVGELYGEILLGDEFIESRGSYDILLGKVFPNGDGGVVGIIGGKGREQAFYSATDRSGNTYIIGGFHDTVDFGGTVLVANDTNSRVLHSCFIASYDRNGFLRWIKQVRTPEGGSFLDNYVLFLSAYVSEEGQTTIIGHFYGEVILDSMGVEKHINEDTTNTFFLSLNTDGEYQWLKTFRAGTSGLGGLSTIISARNGEFYYAGGFARFAQMDSIRLTSITPINTNIGLSEADIIVSKLVFPPTKSVENTPLVENPNLSVFPNPATERVTITYNADPGCKVTLLLKDVLGRQITSVFEGKSRIRENKVDFDVSTLPSGTYVISLGLDGRISNSLFAILR